MNDKNISEIRKRMRDNGVFWWQIADKMGVSEMTIYRKIRRPLDDETAKRINQIITDIIRERG